MSESLIERVARAMSKLYHNGESAYWPDYENTARAAIAAMREPTEEMKAEGNDNCRDSKMVWQAMIDKALSEGG
jgi:hypothetical protein